MDKYTDKTANYTNGRNNKKVYESWDFLRYFALEYVKWKKKRHPEPIWRMNDLFFC
jgi:hypothetical protein